MSPMTSKPRNNLLALFVVGILAVMLVPMPSAVLDLLLGLSITISLLILMTVLNTTKPVEFSTFPSVLLFTALFRLALNVASTRLILLEGDAGYVIKAFGSFVIGGDYVVGVVIFLILIVIQFVVITKGQNRISEVAARFTLDAMPGKQMAVDADLNAGIIKEEEARSRREALTHEAEFYGSMDGAGKFVRGDAVAGIIITGINILGGLIIGMVSLGLTASEAFATYTILTVGDGLVSQIPSLVVSTASGLLVTKSASEDGLGSEMSTQMLRRPIALQSVGAILAAMSLLPGMPTIPFLTLAGGLLLISSRAASQNSAEEAEAEAKAEDAAQEDEVDEAEAAQASIEELLTVDRLGIEIGYRLIGLVDPGRHGGLLEHIRSVRRQFASGLGVIIPPIRVKDNVQIDPNGYQIMLGGQIVGRGDLRAGNYLAMDPSGASEPIEGLETIEPAFGLPARWISEGEKDRAEMLGYTVIDAPSVLVTHLTEVLKGTAADLLSRDDVKQLVENLKKMAPAIVDELIPSNFSLGQLQRVLASLLKEQVPVRNLQAILESIADALPETKDPRQLAERVRTKLARTIIEPHLDGDGVLHATVLDPDLERDLSDAITGTDGLGALPPGFLSRFVDNTAAALAEMVQQGREPILITRAALRPFLADAIAGVIPNATVLSYQETAPAQRVETIARVPVPA